MQKLTGFLQIELNRLSKKVKKHHHGEANVDCHALRARND